MDCKEVRCTLHAQCRFALWTWSPYPSQSQAQVSFPTNYNIMLSKHFSSHPKKHERVDNEHARGRLKLKSICHMHTCTVIHGVVELQKLSIHHLKARIVHSCHRPTNKIKQGRVLRS